MLQRILIGALVVSLGGNVFLAVRANRAAAAAAVAATAQSEKIRVQDAEIKRQGEEIGNLESAVLTERNGRIQIKEAHDRLVAANRQASAAAERALARQTNLIREMENRKPTSAEQHLERQRQQLAHQRELAREQAQRRAVRTYRVQYEVSGRVESVDLWYTSKHGTKRERVRLVAGWSYEFEAQSGTHLNLTGTLPGVASPVTFTIKLDGEVAETATVNGAHQHGGVELTLK